VNVTCTADSVDAGAVETLVGFGFTSKQVINNTIQYSDQCYAQQTSVAQAAVRLQSADMLTLRVSCAFRTALYMHCLCIVAYCFHNSILSHSLAYCCMLAYTTACTLSRQQQH
jgi:hypothetical protein